MSDGHILGRHQAATHGMLEQACDDVMSSAHCRLAVVRASASLRATT